MGWRNDSSPAALVACNQCEGRHDNHGLQASRATRRSRGFTLIELMLGTAVMVMTLAALAALTLAVSEGWRAAEEPQNARVSIARGSNRFHEMIKSASYLGWAGPRSDGSGASAVLMWERDEESPGTMQLSELALLEFEPGTRTVTLYRVPAKADNAGLQCDVGDMDEEADVAAFKKAANITAQVVLHDVVELNLWARVPAENADPLSGEETARPTLEYAIRIGNGQDRSWGYETVTVRAPAPRPVKCDDEASCTCTVAGGCTCASEKSCGCSGSAPCRSSPISGCCKVTETAPLTTQTTAQ